MVHNQIKAELELDARAMVEEIRAKQDDWLRTYQADHVADVAAYKFSCTRHGDFLTIAMSRIKTDQSTEVDRFSTTINLSVVKTIRVTSGHGPDREGELNFGVALTPIDKPDVVVREWNDRSDEYGNIGGSLYVAPSGLAWSVTKPKQYRKLCYEIFSLNQPSGNVWFDRNYLTTKVDAVARPADDDIIYFDGLCARLFVPFGMGENVHGRILAEIAAKYEPKGMA